ncbi:CCT domain-containing protein [Tanacetum coccineum]
MLAWSKSVRLEFRISGISDYDLRLEDYLFNVPEPIIEQPLVTLDNMTSAMSMIMCGEEDIPQEIKYTDIESLQTEDVMSNAFYEYNDIFSNDSSSPSRVLYSNSIIMDENLQPQGKMIKSMSSDSLTVDGAHVRLSSAHFTEMELKKVHGMRRAFSEGYIKPQLSSDHATETRMQKLSRYRDKKTKRNFGRKIKYACRKALADGQPRIKGRFAKAEEICVFRK